MNLEGMIEAVLFYKAEPMEKGELCAFLDVSLQDLNEALGRLEHRLGTGAIRLLSTESSVQLVTAPEAAEVIDRLRTEEMARDIGKAGAETLAIILYRGPVTRAEIDFIRGVNSTFILRNLQIRGLIDRSAHPTIPRSFQYRATPLLLAHLGVTNVEALPEYASIMQALDAYEREAAAAGPEAKTAV